VRLGRVFVANRGEIAARVARGCADAGIACVVPDLPSYLDGAAIIAAALDAGADALHPGYGFLSENADFARAVVAAGLTWIGPSAEVIELMGRKDRAREVAARAGVPVVPRFDPDNVLGDAYPVLVKAASGGGGKGMHMVRDAADLSGALATAAREASKAFGDDTLLIERFVEGGRHIEVQVFGDGDGNVVHLFERDCSVQRRHQKILEEAPAPNLDPTVRQVVLDSAVALCREVGYVNAGTVEFLVRGTEVFFLEMNTRLQVEHPVTEEVTGIDLVRWQLAVAAGEALPLAQEQITCTGHAIEARIYAEDPYAGFLPQAGQIVAVQWPWQVRVETAVDGPTRVTTDFDPMLAKIIVAAESREAAIDELVRRSTRRLLRGSRRTRDLCVGWPTAPSFVAGPCTRAGSIPMTAR
jgi:acetyl-CoA/propionyl-CoA carboxylase biotin carboxyl carrier protein